MIWLTSKHWFKVSIPPLSSGPFRHYRRPEGLSIHQAYHIRLSSSFYQPLKTSLPPPPQTTAGIELGKWWGHAWMSFSRKDSCKRVQWLAARVSMTCINMSVITILCWTLFSAWYICCWPTWHLGPFFVLVCVQFVAILPKAILLFFERRHHELLEYIL